MATQPLSQAYQQPAPRSRLVRTLTRVGVFFQEYWVHFIASFFGLICLSAVSVPVLSYFGLDGLAKPMFFALHLICGQIPSHSFYLEGHEVGLCVHCLAIYSAMFASSVIFVLSKKRLAGFPWWLLVLFALPLAYDGFSQMFGLRESTWEIRLLTGALFGIGAAWFALPMIHKGLVEMAPTSA
ncbi:MAG TPA: DUF2085 domain-containing protein [Ktedonobacteraceae bacterium]